MVLQIEVAVPDFSPPNQVAAVVRTRLAQVVGELAAGDTDGPIVSPNGPVGFYRMLDDAEVRDPVAGVAAMNAELAVEQTLDRSIARRRSVA